MQCSWPLTINTSSPLPICGGRLQWHRPGTAAVSYGDTIWLVNTTAEVKQVLSHRAPGCSTHNQQPNMQVHMLGDVYTTILHPKAATHKLMRHAQRAMLCQKTAAP
jgi:hypothetical protein